MAIDIESPGMTPTKEVFNRNVHKCQRCPHVWMSRKGGRPNKCPSCKSMLWDTPRKQKRGPKPGTKQRPRKDAQRKGKRRK